MIPDLEITPEDIAEAALLPFRMSKNVVLEVRRSLQDLRSPQCLFRRSQWRQLTWELNCTAGQ